MIDAPHPYHIKWLNKIIDATNAKIVISSSWREKMSPLMWDRYFASLKIHGEVIDETPYLGTFRGNEKEKNSNI